MRVSVIVPTFNEASGIESFLRQFERQTIPRSEFEIVVVDGGSDDGTVEIAARHADRVIPQVSRGIGGARNDGAAVARADVLATTDADVVVPPGWVERYEAHFRDPEVVAACGPDGPLEDTPKAQAVFLLLRNLIRVAAWFRIYTTGGGNSAFRKSTFLRIGGYRPLPHSDDFEIGLRLKREGRIVYDPAQYVRLSVRRFEKAGYLRTLFTWLRGDLKVLSGQSIEAVEYARQRY